MCIRDRGRADLSGNIDDFLDWAEARSHIKASYVAQLQKPLEELLDIALVDQDDVRQAFVGYLKTTLGRSLEPVSYTHLDVYKRQR